MFRRGGKGFGRVFGRGIGHLPAPLLFVLGGISLNFGAAVAVLLFTDLPPTGVAWLRQLGAALVLLAWRRPGWAAFTGSRLLLAGSFGLVTALMNLVYYEAIARIPLGTAVALEFCGPVVVAAIGSRGRRDLLAVALAGVGVFLIADVRWSGSGSGVLFALGAAVLWAGYILLGKLVASRGSGVDDLAVGFTVAAVLLCPLAVNTMPAWRSPRLLLFGIGVGVLSSVVPYVLDQIVLRRVGRSTFALLLALIPLTAALMGFVVLGQVPGLAEAGGIAAVVIAVLLRSRPRDLPVTEPV